MDGRAGMARAGIENEACEPMERALGYSLRQAACPKLRFAHSLTPTKHNYYVPCWNMWSAPPPPVLPPTSIPFLHHPPSSHFALSLCIATFGSLPSVRRNKLTLKILAVSIALGSFSQWKHTPREGQAHQRLILPKQAVNPLGKRLTC